MQIGNLNSITEQVKSKQQQSATTTEKPDLSKDVLRKTWNDYAETARDSVRVMLKNTELIIQEEQIIARVGTKLAQNIIQQERNLVQLLRKTFQRPRLAVQVQIDSTKTPPKVEQPKRKLTPKEKLGKMIEQNPLVRDLYERFDLTVDE